MKSSLKKYTGLMFALGTFALTVLFFQTPLLHSVVGTDIFRSLEQTGLDVLFRARGTRDWTNKVMMVRIDDFTDKNLGWPIPRDQYGAVMALLLNSGATAVALDVPLPPREREDSTEEHMMVEYLQGTQGVFPVIGPFIPSGTSPGQVSRRDVDSSAHVVIGNFGIPAPRDHVFPRSPFINDYPFPELAQVSTGVGHISLIADSLDGVIRATPLFIEYAGKLYPTLGLALSLHEQRIEPREITFQRNDDGMLVTARNISIQTGLNGEVLINYVGSPEIFPSVSFFDILLAARDRDEKFFEQFKGKVCIIGPTVRSLGDFYATPIAESTPGYITHANIYDMIAGGTPFITASWWLQVTLLFVFTMLVGIMAHNSTMRVGVVVLLTTLILYLAFAFIMWTTQSTWFNVVEPMFAFSLAFVSTVSYRAATEGRQKKMITDMFGRYVDSTVVKILVANPQMFKLGGEKKEITLLFSDLKGFSSISEKLEDEVLVKLLNIYFTEMTKVITSTKGTVDKYIGDAIMAFWGAPLADGDSAYHACKAALDMQRRLTKIQAKVLELTGVEIKQRVGVNTGLCTVGNMGSATKVNYTAIGDPVNLASRLEGVNKQYGTSILISEMTQKKVGARMLTREVDRVVVVGKTEPVSIFELLDDGDKPLTEKNRQFMEVYQEGLKAYRERRWDEGIAYMEHATTFWPNDAVCQLYAERMRLYQIHPPKSDWNGVFILDSK